MDGEKFPEILHEHSEKLSATFEDGETRESLAVKQKIERRVVWKQDLTILPLLAMCFFFSYVVCHRPTSHPLIDLND
jgi:hypothetical protein